jgi:hypothetical protein
VQEVKSDSVATIPREFLAKANGKSDKRYGARSNHVRLLYTVTKTSSHVNLP